MAGWDTHEGGSVYGIPLGGTMLRLPFATGGFLFTHSLISFALCFGFLTLFLLLLL